jgi:hypothetical protein
MNWFNRLEQKYGRYAIHNLMFYIIGIYVVGFIIAMFAPNVYSQYLSLDVSMVLKGQVWRLVTFILQPPSYSLLFIIFVLYFYYVIGTFLESAWGAFKFNVYYFSGVLLHIIAAFLIYAIFGESFTMSAYYINRALFMAFAVEQAETKVYLFFIIPVKMKWLGIIDGVLFAVTIVCGYLTPVLPRSLWSVLYSMGLLGGSVYTCYVNATCALVSMLNFVIFLIITLKGSAKSQTQRNFEKARKTAAKAQMKREQHQRIEFAPKTPVPKTFTPNQSGAKHKCAVCGRTENDGEELVFRYCSKCNGAYEYCNDHLYTHVHVK